MRGSNSKNKKKTIKTASSRLLRDEMGLKSRDPRKAHLGHLLNNYTEFKAPNLIWRRVVPGTHPKNEKKRLKNHSFRAVKG